MADLDEVFIPIKDGLFVNPIERRYESIVLFISSYLELEILDQQLKHFSTRFRADFLLSQ